MPRTGAKDRGPRTGGGWERTGLKDSDVERKKGTLLGTSTKAGHLPIPGLHPPKADTQSKCVEVNRPARMSQTLRQPQHHVELPTGWSATGWRTSRHRGQPPRVSRVEGGWPADRAALLWKLRNSGHWNGVGIFGPGTD